MGVKLVIIVLQLIVVVLSIVNAKNVVKMTRYIKQLEKEIDDNKKKEW